MTGWAISLNGDYSFKIKTILHITGSNGSQKNWVIATNWKSLQPGGVILWYFKLRLLDLSGFRIHSLKYLRSMTLGCNDTEIRKSEFVAKTQFLYVQWFPWFTTLPYKPLSAWSMMWKIFPFLWLKSVKFSISLYQESASHF